MSQPLELDDSDVLLLRLFSEGLTLPAIARRTDSSERTVRRRLRQVCNRIGVATPVEAVVLAVRLGLF